MTDDDHAPREGVIVARVDPDHWRLLRDARLAALADAPASFAPSRQDEAGHGETHWRAMAADAAMYVASAGGTPVGLAAGVPRDSDDVKGLGAMWVAPAWRGRGVAAQLVDAVVTWATRVDAHELRLWAPADDARALRFYERQGFRRNGRTMPFPRKQQRWLCEMSMPLG